MKICTRCKASKENTCFTKDKTSSDGFSRWCKECKKKSDQRYVHLPGGGKTKEYAEITIEMYTQSPRNVKLTQNNKRGRIPLEPMTHVERDASRNNHYKRRLKKYQISADQHENLLNSQNYKCLICEEAIDISSHIDHCHKTLRVRGILCYKCNLGLGFFRDNEMFLKNAIKYLNLPEISDTLS